MKKYLKILISHEKSGFCTKYEKFKYSIYFYLFYTQTKLIIATTKQKTAFDLRNTASIRQI